jgi:HEAT repeat protein
MLDLGQLREDNQALNKGDDASRRKALRSLKAHSREEWAPVARDLFHTLINSLQKQLQASIKQKPIVQEVLAILGNMGQRAEPALPQVIGLLGEDFPPDLRGAAAAAMGKIGCADQKGRAALLSLWQSAQPSHVNRMQVAIALCKLDIKAEGLLKLLTSTLVANPDAAVRKSAAEALAWRAKNELDVVPALLTSTLNDKDETVRQVAEASLTELKLSRAKAIQVCAEQLSGSTYAELALKNSGQQAVPALIAALESTDPLTREKAARTLGSIGEAAAEATRALTKTMHDKNLNVRLAAAKGLWNVTKNADLVGPVLVELLKAHSAERSDDGETRRRSLQTVIEALQRMGPPAKVAVPALRAMTKDKNRHISESAQSALRDIAPPVAAGIR